jgi:formylglycine-generating enzyme required for sulfatase activity
LVLALYRERWETAGELAKSLRPRLQAREGIDAWRARVQQQMAARGEGSAAMGGIKTRISEQDGKEMVYVPAGAFLYGDDKKERTVGVFWIDRTPVTNAEYARFVQETGHTPPQHWKGATPPDEIADHPVVHVSWHDAQAYAEWVGKRLPVGAEWEKAARGTDGRVYPWGDEWRDGVCNTRRLGIGHTMSVGQFSPPGDSPYGCADMAGNVWQWADSRQDLERGCRILRGGSCNNDASSARVASRLSFAANGTYHDLGFRCILPLSGAAHPARPAARKTSTEQESP